MQSRQSKIEISTSQSCWFCICFDNLHHFSVCQVIVVSGETGCGKTTQIPQFILESEIEANRGALCSIICTQPRKISAMSVSERVACERGEPLGESVSFPTSSCLGALYLGFLTL